MSVVQTAVRKVVRLGRPVLRKTLRRVTPEQIASPDVRRLVQEMAVTMVEYEGVGIAANQVGEDLQCFLMGLESGGPRHAEGIPLTVVFNPEVRFLGKKLLLDWEGCLSVPGLRGQVPRAAKLELAGLDERGRPFKRVYEGFPARVVQHEFDHLHGKVYLDRMPDLKTLAFL